MELSHSRSIGLYSLLAKIGEGGFSYVFLAVKDGEPYALKCLKPEKARDPQVVTNFVREVKIGSRLDHPNIAAVIDHGKSGGVYFSVSNLLLGDEIVQILQDWQALGKRVPLPFSLYLIRECCRILTYLHHKTVFEHSKSVLFHGDFTPDNMLVLSDGSIRLIDFGSAGQETVADPTQRHVGRLFYVPPELIRGEAPSTHTDIYALGVMSFYLLFGRRPFEGATNREQIELILNAPLPQVEATGLVKTPAEANALRVFFQKALHKDRKIRVQSVEEFEQQFFHFRFFEAPAAHLLEVQKNLPPAFLERMRKRDAEWTEQIRIFRQAGTSTAIRGKAVEPILSHADRRRHPRVSLQRGMAFAKVFDEKERATMSTEIREVGFGGMLVSWKGLEPKRGEEYAVTLQLGRNRLPVQGRAKLLYEIRIQSESYAGFQFTKMSSSDLGAIEKFVQEHLEKEPPPPEAAQAGAGPVILDVFFKTEEELRREFEQNMKFGGMSVEGPLEVRQGEKVVVQIHLPHSLRGVTLKGEVVFAAPKTETTQNLALHLEGDPEKIKEILFGALPRE